MRVGEYDLTWMEVLTKAIGAGVLVCATLSVAHEFGYFWVVGYDFMSLLVPTDYIRLTIGWLPVLLLIIPVGMFVGLHIARELPAEEPVYATQRKKPVLGADVFFGSFALMIVPIVIKFPHIAVGYVAVAAVVVGWLFVRADIFRVKNDVMKRRRIFVILVMLFLVAGVFTKGMTSASFDLKYPPQSAAAVEVPLRWGERTSERRLVHVLKVLDKGLLIRDHRANEIGFIPWADIKSYSKKHTYSGSRERSEFEPDPPQWWRFGR
jgi:hypothetical protein